MPGFTLTHIQFTDADLSEDPELLEYYQAILKLKPRLENVLQCLNEQPEQLTQLDSFIKEIETAISDAQTDNTSSLKPTIIKYILTDPDANLEPKVPDTGTKACQAFQHLVFACHLCPIKKLALFDCNPQLFIDNVNEGKNIITASGWPSFIYNLDQFDPNDLTKGLMRGLLLLQVFRHIFTSPFSALSGHQNATKPCITHLHGLKEVTPRTIGYACVQVTVVSISIMNMTIANTGNGDMKILDK
ncbi:hypothetical protein C0995_010435 [Termitomyces sp. Mi166|nr:hypothetical protein C0995_010435 [Termitomyces sp. Mi166\